MAARLTATFELIDRMSDAMEAMADRGVNAIARWERAGDAADSAFNTAESGGQRAATVCDGVASSARSMGDAMDDSSDSTKEMEDALRLYAEISGEAGDAARRAAEYEDYWTDAVGNYDKVALAALNTTQELVDQGYLLEGVLKAEAAAAKDTEDALNGLEQQSEDTGQKGVEAFEAIGNTLIGAAIAKQLKEAAEAAYELVDAFSEAESTVVIATGATGTALDGLTASMNKAYAASKTGDLQQTAAAVGEINTRLGYTGEALEETTGLFLDFAAVTGGQASSSVRSVTQLMNQWNIGANQLEGTLDKLTYAGQASGISVNSLSSQLTANKSVLDQLGFSLDESIAMFSQFELNGTQAASVMTGFRTALSNGTISSLEDLYEVFDRISTGEIDAAGAAEIFGARAGTTIVNAVNNGTFALDDMVDALENTRGTTVATAEAAQTLGQQWEQASNNINAAFTSAIEPVTSRISSGLASVANGVGTFLNEHPAVTKAITAVGVGLGVVAVGIAGVSVASLEAIPAVAAFGTALHGALGPIGWVAAGITALTAGALLLYDAINNAEDATERLTYTSREHEEQLASLNEQYEEACSVYGQASEQAGELALQIAQLESSYEDAGRTIGQFIDEINESGEAIANISQSYEDAINSAAELQGNSTNLASQLLVLSGHTSTAGADLDVMSGIVDKLNSSYDNLGLTIDETTGKLNMSIPDLYGFIQTQAEEQKKQAASDALVEAVAKYGEVRQEMLDASAEVSAAWDSMNDLEAKWKQEHPVLNAMGVSATVNGDYSKALEDWAMLKDASADARQNYDDLTNSVQKYCEALGYSSDEIEEFISQLDAAADGIVEVQEATISYEEAVSAAISSVQDDIDELCAAYDAAYESARNSIDGQIGLFDTMKTETELSVSDMQAAFASQLEYLALYTENLRKAAEYGIDEGLIASLSDGSEESAGYINAIIENIESLGAESEEAQAFVDDFNSAFHEVEQAKDEFASTVAEMETDFDAKMAEIEGRLEESIDNMNMEADAAAAASATMQAYTQAIIDGTASAVSAAQSASSAVAAALNSSGTTGTTTTVAGHAEGTTSGEDVYVAGEDGPELIIGRRGSTVFPADETQKIINAVDNSRGEGSYCPPEYYMSGGDTVDSTSNTSGTGGQWKHIIEIDGKGSIGLTGGMDEDTAMDFLIENIKPVLSQILTQEIFEEGDGSYEY